MIHRLALLRLPDGSDLIRDLPAKASDPEHPGWARYDRRTLVYDAVHLPHRGRLRLYLPRSLNLWPLLEGAELRIDGRPAGRPARRVTRRFETLEVPCDGPPGEATLEVAGLGTHRFPVPRNAAPYAGRRVIYTLLRNERLDWVRDWLLFHAREHGADAVLIADNGSTDYGPEDLLEVARGVPGYAAAEVLSVPLPWGAAHIAPGVDDGKYLQTTLLNLVRDRFLRDAEAVLNVDVDELVARLGDRSVFDAAVRWGYATFPGRWHYADGSHAPARHADHVLTSPGQKPCPTKYVYRPRSRLGRMTLSVHSIEGLSRKLFSARREARFLHCRAISMSWKHDRTADLPPDLVADDDTRRLFERAFG